MLELLKLLPQTIHNLRTDVANFIEKLLTVYQVRSWIICQERCLVNYFLINSL